MRRSAPSVSLTNCEKAGVTMRFATFGSLVKAKVISSRNCERMMQPARQILAIVGIGRFQPNSFEASAMTAKPCA
ncbi:hypothetical protein D3C87_1928820 [compost metagenome]